MTGREIQVYSFGLELGAVALAEMETLLSEAELDRAARFRFARDRERYVAAHGTLRRILGRVLGRRPRELAFVYGLRGKPALATGHGREPIHFNLSRSGGLALVALAKEGEVGVDVEQVRPLDALAVGRRMFAPAEYATLLAIPEAERLAAFLHYWSRKEAVVKTIGQGLFFPLHSFLLSPSGGESLETIRLDTTQGGIPIWVGALPAPRAGYTAAVASTFAPAAICLEGWEDAA